MTTKTEDTQEEISKEEALKDTKSTKKSKTKKSATTKLKEELAEAQLEIQEQKDKFLRLFAEFDNFKKRNMKERLELMKSASQDVISTLLPVLDDFDRAKKYAEDESSTESFSDGVSAVYTKLHTVLQNKGLKPMESTGETFDAELHEAITEIPAPTEDMKGKIIDTIESGYYLNEKIIRHAKVVVGK